MGIVGRRTRCRGGDVGVRGIVFAINNIATGNEKFVHTDKFYI